MDHQMLKLTAEKLAMAMAVVLVWTGLTSGVLVSTAVAQPTVAAPTGPVATPELCKLSVSDLSDGNVRGATVQVDGKVAGQAPLTIEIAPGAHLLVIQKPGFLVFQRKITLRIGHMQVLAPILVRAANARPTQGGEVRAAPKSVDASAVAGRAANPVAANPVANGRPSAQETQNRGQTANPTQHDDSAAPRPDQHLDDVTDPPNFTGSGHQMQLTRGGRTLQGGALVLDVGVGYPNYLLIQGSAGLIETRGLRLDASIWARSRLAITEGGLRMRLQLAGRGRFSVVGIGTLGAGGGTGGRDSYMAGFGVGAVIVVAEKFALGMRAMVNMWSERLCPKPGSENEGKGADVCQGDGDVKTAKALHTKTLSDRDTNVALRLAVTLEIAMSDRTQLFVVGDVAPGQTERAGYSGVFNGALITDLDPGYSGRVGFSFVF